jgi:3-oxoacyl-[acyl-carrier-protein] synthase III
MTTLQSVAVLRSSPQIIDPDNLAAGCEWRAVCESPGATPADMAVQAGRAALAAAEASCDQVQWILHAGVGHQGSQGWPIHHHIQNGIVGRHGNALELKQYCAGGLTSWMLASRLITERGVAVCTGADNWSWTDRFTNSRTVGGEPYSDIASATVLSPRGGFAKVLSSATASCPDMADDWRIHDTFWDSTGPDDFHAAYIRAAAARSDEKTKASFDMFARAITAALGEARMSPQYVTYFVPHGSGSGQPYRLLAKVLGLPWSDDLYQHSLDHGYLGISTQADGLVYLASTGGLRTDSIVLLVAAEYNLSATATVLRVVRPPSMRETGMIRVIA